MRSEQGPDQGLAKPVRFYDKRKRGVWRQPKQGGSYPPQIVEKTIPRVYYTMMPNRQILPIRSEPCSDRGLAKASPAFTIKETAGFGLCQNKADLIRRRSLKNDPANLLYHILNAKTNVFKIAKNCEFPLYIFSILWA